MSANSDSFIKRLNELPNVDKDDSLVIRLDELLELIENDPDTAVVIPHIFAFFEAHPDADFGLPGPLVHFLEAQPEYEKYLIESVQRKANCPTIIMVNRILNSTISLEKRTELLNLLKSVESNPQNDEAAREQAEHYLAYQAKRRRS